MPVLYAVIARGPTILSKYASCAGNFTEVTEQILAKITPDNARLTYAHNRYLFHYVIDDGITYLCITNDEFERQKAFSFLNEIKRRFKTNYGIRAQTALPYAMDGDFATVLSSQMKHFSENQTSEPLGKVQTQLDELKDIMVQNIDTVVSRGERLDLLVDKTENLSSSSVSFRKTSRNLARSMLLKNIKLTVFICVIVILVLYFIVSAACGGLAWQSCV